MSSMKLKYGIISYEIDNEQNIEHDEKITMGIIFPLFTPFYEKKGLLWWGESETVKLGCCVFSISCAAQRFASCWGKKSQNR